MKNHPPPREGGPERALDVSEPVPSAKSPEDGEPNDCEDGNAEGGPPPGCPKGAHGDELCGSLAQQLWPNADFGSIGRNDDSGPDEKACA